MTTDDTTANLAVEGPAGTGPDGKISRAEGTLGAGDTFLSLNGYDELAITQAFGTTVSKLREADERTTFMRALVFVDKRRKLQGSANAHDQAYDQAMVLTVAQVMDYFPADDDDEDSDQGEGGGR